MNGKMSVNLGVWPIFAFLFNPAFWAGVKTVAITTATAVPTAMTLNSIIQSFDRPETNVAEITGSLAVKEFSPQIAQLLQQQATELTKLHEEELKKEEEMQSLETQKVRQEKLQEAISKYGPLLLIGGGMLLVVLLKKRKKQ